MLTRKQLLAAGGAAAVSALWPWETSATAQQALAQPGAINLTQFYLASHPPPVQAAIERHRAGLDAGAYEYIQNHEPDLEAAMSRAAARHLGVPGAEIAFTDSTTMGIGLLYRGLLRPTDEVLTTAHDFYATFEALRLSRARIKRVRLYRDPARASVAEIVDAIRRGMTRRTRVVAITWVHSSTGVKLPLREICDAVAGRALVCVDAVHGFGAEPSHLPDLGCDAFVSGCHKWLRGPRGTGLVWARPAVWGRVQPTIPTFDDNAFGSWLSHEVPTGRPPGPFHSPGGFHAFEHRWALPEAFRLHAQLGQDAVAGHIRGLAAQLKRGLAAIPGVHVATPMRSRLSAGLVCFEARGLTPERLVDRLATQHKVIASVTPYPRTYARMGPGLGNTASDVEAAVEAVAAVASAGARG